MPKPSYTIAHPPIANSNWVGSSIVIVVVSEQPLESVTTYEYVPEVTA